MTKHLYHWAIGISLLGLPAAAKAAEASVAPVMSEEAELLERLGERARQVWDNLSLVTCTEDLLQEKLNEKGKVVIRSKSSFDYFILLSWDAGKLVMDESRVEIDPPRKRRPKGALLTTQGFATLLLVVHPEFQTSYSFSLGEKDPATGLTPLHFVPRNSGPTPGALELSGRTYPITWAGTVWVNRNTAEIIRTEARWYQPPEQLGLESLSAGVDYAPVKLEERTLQLPQKAKVELSTEHQWWRNTHTFAGYRLFSVETNISIGDDVSENPPSSTGPPTADGTGEVQ